MSFVFISWFTNFLVTSLTVALLGFIIYLRWSFNYFTKRGIPNVRPPTIPFGSVPFIIPPEKCLGSYLKDLYAEGKLQGLKYGGSFAGSVPKYYPIDIELVKNILQRDFSYFTERGFYYNEKDDPLSANLFAIGGEKWQFLRTKLSPTFTSGKLKLMMNGLLQCASQLRDELEKKCKNRQTMNVKDISECFTIDVIGLCVFGLDCNCFKYPDAEFKKQGRRIFAFNIPRIFKICLAFSFPNFAHWLGLRLFDEETTQFFLNLVKETLTYRETNKVVRKDFLQLLFDLRNGSEVEGKTKSDRFTIDELTAQAFIFFAAGFETSSITLTFCLYELAVNPEIQDKLRKEITEVVKSYKGNLCYDAIMEMKYLHQVVEETLRKYPPVAFITRVCVKDYRIPDTNVTMEKGIETVISILGIHHDPEYYPEPEKFDPERFSDENKKQRIPFTYMPFGEGPRICIGLRFGLMQVKVALAVLLEKYSFSLNNKTKVPLRMDLYSFTLSPRDEILLDVEKVNRI